jgi:hypothetical protein
VESARGGAFPRSHAAASPNANNNATQRTGFIRRNLDSLPPPSTACQDYVRRRIGRRDGLQ